MQRIGMRWAPTLAKQICAADAAKAIVVVNQALVVSCSTNCGSPIGKRLGGPPVGTGAGRIRPRRMSSL